MFPKLLKMVQVEHLKLLKIRLWDFIIGLLKIGINMRLKSSEALGPRWLRPTGEAQSVVHGGSSKPEPFNPTELEQAFSGAYRS